MDETALRKLIAKRFLQRTDLKAVQDSKGYHPEKSKWTGQDVLDHIQGKTVYGHYLLDTDNNCKLFAFDLDIQKAYLDQWRKGEEFRDLAIMQLNALGEGLARRTHKLFGIDVAAAFSGNKGLHVYGFTGTEQAQDVKEAAVSVLDSFNCFEATRGNNFFKHKYGEHNTIEIEVFPKQVAISEEGYGNLMRLPLGTNRRSGQKGFFVKFIPPMNEFIEMDPLDALSGVKPWVD